MPPGTSIGDRHRLNRLLLAAMPAIGGSSNRLLLAAQSGNSPHSGGSRYWRCSHTSGGGMFGKLSIPRRPHVGHSGDPERFSRTFRKLFQKFPTIFLNFSEIFPQFFEDFRQAFENFSRSFAQVFEKFCPAFPQIFQNFSQNNSQAFISKGRISTTAPIFFGPVSQTAPKLLSQKNCCALNQNPDHNEYAPK